MFVVRLLVWALLLYVEGRKWVQVMVVCVTVDAGGVGVGVWVRWCCSCGAPIRKFSPASKHFDIEDKYVVQCSQDKIVKVIHMPGTIDSDNNNPQPGDGFCVDALTKPMPQVLHDIYYAEMQG